MAGYGFLGGDSSRDILRGAKTAICGKILTVYSVGGLLFRNGKSKNSDRRSLLDYVHTNSGGVG